MVGGCVPWRATHLCVFLRHFMRKVDGSLLIIIVIIIPSLYNAPILMYSVALYSL